MMSIVMFYLVLKKEISELKIASVILFTGVAVFVSLIAIQLLVGIDEEYRTPASSDELWVPHPNSNEFWATL